MSAVVWHDIECGRYTQDLPLWQELAEQSVADGQALLDVGAGTGRVSLALARAGHSVVALDLDADLLAELERRAELESLPVRTVRADARRFEIPHVSFALIVVPMQTLQLLGGPERRRAFMERARAHMRPGALLAVSIAKEEDFEEFEWHEGDASPLPDVAEDDVHSYFSQPTAVRRSGDRFLLLRRRERVDAAGERSVSEDSIALDIVAVSDLLAAGAEVGLTPLSVREVPATDEHIGSQVVIFTV